MAMTILGESKRAHVALLVETSLASGRDILRGIASYVRTHDSWALYHEAHGLEDSVPRWFHKWRGDGIIARFQNPALVKIVEKMGIPVVDVLGVVPAASKFPLVHVNDVHIAHTAVEHLLERGFRRFGYVGIQGENWSDARRDAFAERVRSAGHPLSCFETTRSHRAEASWDAMERKLVQWVKSLEKPCGIMVCSDQRGARLLEACRTAGVLIPDEIGVIGVDDDETLCDVCNPPLSSVKPNHVGLGYEAAALLDRMMKGEAAPTETLFVEPRGVTTRLSSDVLAIEDRKIAAVLRMIRESDQREIRVDDLARLSGLSRSVLQRRFRAIMNCSIHQEVLRLRVQRAQTLLIETDLPLAEIAERTGFKHQEYMGSVFKIRTGKTPGALRREFQSKKPF